MKRKQQVVAAAVLLVVLATAGWLVFGRDGTDDRNAIIASGTVEATEADLGFQAGGRIASIEVREGDAVEPGAVLARLDVAELEARRAAAEAQVSAARALLLELERGARPEERRQAEAAERAARRRLEEMTRTHERTQTLYEGGAVSREQLDQSGTALEAARAQHEQAAQQLRMVREGPRSERVSAQQAVVAQAEAALAQVDAQLDNTVVRAPFAGVVSVRHRETGETVAPGLPVVSVQNLDDRWVRIYVREDQLGRVSLGQTAEIRSDTFRDRAYPGRVAFIASEAEFTPRNVQTEEERVKLVYAVKVAVQGDARVELRPGVPADVTLHVAPADR